MRKKLLIFIVAVFSIFVLFGCGKVVRIESGIVTAVEIEIIPRDFLSSGKVLTIVTFKDGRVVLFSGRVHKIYLNKCNEFMQTFWQERIYARLCK